MFRWFIAIAFVIPVAAAAASEEDLDALHAALDTDALMVILSEEGIDQSNELREDMFPGRGGVGWNAVVGTWFKPFFVGKVYKITLANFLA